MEAYSRPITPAPTTIICLGKPSAVRSWSESMMRWPSKRDAGAVRGARAAGDEDALGGDGTWPLGVSTSRVCGSAKRAVPCDGLDAVALELAAHHLGLAVEHGSHPRREVRHRDPVLEGVVPAVEGPLAEAREIEDGFPEGLAREWSRYGCRRRRSSRGGRPRPPACRAWPPPPPPSGRRGRCRSRRGRRAYRAWASPKRRLAAEYIGAGRLRCDVWITS